MLELCKGSPALNNKEVLALLTGSDTTGESAT